MLLTILPTSLLFLRFEIISLHTLYTTLSLKLYGAHSRRGTVRILVGCTNRYGINSGLSAKGT